MDVKQAVALAKRHIVELFCDEKISDVGLEEVEFEEQPGEWIITVGFFRSWDVPRNPVSILTASPRRTYKVLRIADQTGEVKSLRNHEVPA